MNSNTTIEEFMRHLESKLKLSEIQHKDHALLLSLALIVALVAVMAIQYLSRKNLRAKASNLGLFLLDKAFRITEQLNKELPKMKKEIHKMKETDIKPVYEKITKLTDDQIEARLKQVIAVDRKRENTGKESGNYYFSKKENHREFVSEWAKHFLYTNIMHFDACKGSVLIENELISFFKHLLHAPKEGVGLTTIGGTESIFLSMLTMREYGLKKGIEDPEVVAFESAHAAFQKSAFYLKLKLVLVKIDPRTGHGNADDLLDAINENTVGVVVSGGSYANGLLDPVQEVAEGIRGRGLLMHVDSCLGGFMTCMSKIKGDNLCPSVDFTVPEVTSISIDPHKYGEGPKGCSILMYRREELKLLSAYSYPYWNGGFYFSQSFPGSRGCAPFVGAWISLVRYGIEGLLKTYDTIKKARDIVLRDVSSIPELEIVGNPVLCVVSFCVKKNQRFTVFALHEALGKSGWALSVNQSPFSIHISITKHNAEALPTLKDDLIEAIQLCKQQKDIGKNNGYGSMYGGLMKIPDGRMAMDVVKMGFIESNKLKPDEC